MSGSQGNRKTLSQLMAECDEIIERIEERQRMDKTYDAKGAALSAEAAYVLWAVAFDDDDLASHMLDLFVLKGGSLWLSEMSEGLSGKRRLRLERLDRCLRIKCLAAEEMIQDRIHTYVQAELDDKVPF